MLLKEKAGLDVQAIRAQFPVLQKFLSDEMPLIYLDNAATTQKPQQVIDRIKRFYEEECATVRRGVYSLSEKATAQYEAARKKVADFLGAESREIVFSKGCTEAINLVAQSYGKSVLESGDTVLISAMEHHANLVPWQLICAEKGADLRVIPIDQDGELVKEEFYDLLELKPKILAITHISNVLGTVNPIKLLIDAAHRVGAKVLVDAAQSAPHQPLDLKDLNPDFLVISGHKLYGPTGIGVLYGRYEILAEMPPYQAGGDMIESVSFEKTTFTKPPHRFEAGTPPVAGALGLAEAIDFIKAIGLDKIQTYEAALLDYATTRLSQIPELQIHGQANEKASLISFTLDHIHPHDIGTILDQEVGVAIRAGHHCAQPLMKLLGVPATARASFAFYNTFAEIDKLAQGIEQVRTIFNHV
ncbi:MAG: cysteine desulfurase [Candidatus Caenarcaniphilales bacterium]|nr:cysteine desulfurase [Candidatus Caenarcaniphilales bacterium]